MHRHTLEVSQLEEQDKDTAVQKTHFIAGKSKTKSFDDKTQQSEGFNSLTFKTNLHFKNSN